MKLLVILGEGGHTTELLNLVELLGKTYDYYYVISKEDNLAENRIKYLGPKHYLTRPRGKDTALFKAMLQTIWVAVQSMQILWLVRPDAILSAGPAIAVPISILGKLSGARIIFVECASRVRGLSLTGRIMYRWADLFFVQWPQLAGKLPKAIYAGRCV